MITSWTILKKFINDNNLIAFLNYLETVDGYYAWLSYQNENFSVTLSKGSVDCEDFENNYKNNVIIKNDLAADGMQVVKITHVLHGRLLKDLFVQIKTSTKEYNDVTGLIFIKLLNEQGQETNVGSEAVKTCIDFKPNFDYELYGGGLQTLDDLDSNIYVSSLIVPDIPAQYGGSVYFVINKKILLPKENVFISGVGTTEILYDSQHPEKSVVRIEIGHPKGEEHQFQVELQYYK